MLAALEAQKPAWAARGEPGFIPFPATWLNQQRWQDEPDAAQPPSRKDRIREANDRAFAKLQDFIDRGGAPADWRDGAEMKLAWQPSAEEIRYANDRGITGEELARRIDEFRSLPAVQGYSAEQLSSGWRIWLKRH
jgi:hypothetical protein